MILQTIIPIFYDMGPSGPYTPQDIKEMTATFIVMNGVWFFTTLFNIFRFLKFRANNKEDSFRQSWSDFNWMNFDDCSGIFTVTMDILMIVLWICLLFIGGGIWLSKFL